MDLVQAKKLAQNALEITALRDFRNHYNTIGSTSLADDYDLAIARLMDERDGILNENR